jgi:ribonuclease HI
MGALRRQHQAVAMNPSERSSNLEKQAELAEKRLAEALQQLEQERRRAEAMEAKLRELNIPLDFLAVAPSPTEKITNPENHRTVNRIQSIYTDGACSGNPGPGGWGVVVYFSDGSVHEIGGGERQTTNNRMEMQAAIAALQFLEASGQTEPIVLYTDSEYVMKGITQWIFGWKKKGWKTSTGKPVLNQDLWQVLDSLNSRTGKSLAPVEWRYVRGHSGNAGNDRCDTIARAFATGATPALKQG